MESWTKVADDIYADHGLTKAGVQAFARILRKHLKEVLPLLAQIWLHDAMRRHRIRLMRAPVAMVISADDARSTRETTQEIEIVDLLTRRSIGDWPLWDGTRLRDATREQIEAQIAKLSTQRDGLQRNIGFLRRVADRLKSGERVSDRIPEQELATLAEVEAAA